VTASVTEKRSAFAALHTGPGVFVMPNPWDVGSARWLAALGFPALATTSAGMAFALGKPDGGVTRAQALAHIRGLAGATDLPLNADYEACFAESREAIAESVALCVETGVAGFSIEDFSGDPKAPFFDVAVAARAAIDATGARVLLTARSEIVLHGHDGGLGEALRRITAYAGAGADVLYVPGVRDADSVRAIVSAVAPKPVNVLVSAPVFTVRQLEDLGVRRISVGSALANAAWGGFLRAARDIADHGRFDAFAQNAPYAELNAFFRGPDDGRA
jgi:2-methylisocitrate lyase-like PEP mutase family enzyme